MGQMQIGLRSWDLHLLEIGASDGFVVFRIKDDARGQRHFAMLLAAKSAGVSVTVSVDDTVRDAGGYCFVRWIS